MSIQKQPRDCRTFSDEFKQQTLILIRSGEKSAAQVCREFDLTSSTAVHWVKAEREVSLHQLDDEKLLRLIKTIF